MLVQQWYESLKMVQLYWTNKEGKINEKYVLWPSQGKKEMKMEFYIYVRGKHELNARKSRFGCLNPEE
jgi:hypothetical protein